MFTYVSDLLTKNQDGHYEIPMDRVKVEDQKRINNLKIDVTYVFDDTSSITIRYTRNNEKILKKTSGTIKSILNNNIKVYK